MIPDDARLGGTLRSTSDEGIQRLRRRVEEVAAGTAAAYGCMAEVDWLEQIMPYYPPTENDPAATSFVKDVATRWAEGRAGVGSHACVV